MIVRQVLEGSTDRGIFRRAALERLNSPEQLDQRTSVIPPALRVLVASVTVIVLAVLAWAVFGSVPTRTTGRGVLLSDREGNFAISQVATGLDSVFSWTLRRALGVIPDVAQYSFTDFVAEGVAISGPQMGWALWELVRYVLPWAVLAYYLLKWREVAGST